MKHTNKWKIAYANIGGCLSTRTETDILKYVQETRKWINGNQIKSRKCHGWTSWGKLHCMENRKKHQKSMRSVTL